MGDWGWDFTVYVLELRSVEFVVYGLPRKMPRAYLGRLGFRLGSGVFAGWKGVSMS